MSDSYDDYEAKMQLADYAWENRVVKTEHDRAVELAQAYERGWNAALAQQEPVAWMYVNKDGECEQIEFGPVPNDPEVTPLYTAPPKKEWAGLTEAERVDIIDIEIPEPNDDHWALAQSIEAALKEKNT